MGSASRHCAALALLVVLAWPTTTVAQVSAQAVAQALDQAPSQTAGAPIPPHRAEYLLTRDGLPFGIMTLELVVEPGGRYRYLARTEPHAAMALVSQALDLGADPSQLEESVGQVTAGRFRPDAYRFRRKGGDNSRALDLRFDWDQGRALMDSEDKPWSMPVPAETQDKLSVLLALRQDVAQVHDQAQSEHRYSVADGGRLKEYRFRVLGREALPGPDGDRDTLALERIKDGQEPDYRLWLDPAQQLLPVRVEREEGGSLYVMELVGIGGDASATGATGPPPAP
jgi:hypothetical protein